jgi:hypothetical protein
MRQVAKHGVIGRFPARPEGRLAGSLLPRLGRESREAYALITAVGERALER